MESKLILPSIIGETRMITVIMKRIVSIVVQIEPLTSVQDEVASKMDELIIK